MYRSIGINRTGVTSVCQIRSDVPEEIKGVEWICFASTTFNTLLPVYTNVPEMPKYLSSVGLEPSTENLYWASRMIAALADHNYPTSIQNIERYQNSVVTKGRQILLEYDRKMAETGSWSLASEANQKLCAMAKKETDAVLGKVLQDASEHMKNGYNRADN